MPRDNKTSKADQQRGKDRVGAASIHSKSRLVQAAVNKNGLRLSNSKPIETWDKTTELANQTRRSRQLKVTMPKLPWDKEN